MSGYFFVFRTFTRPELKPQYFGYLMPTADKTPMQAKEKGATEDETVGWHHRCNGCELGQAVGDGEGQRSLACCSPWGCKELDVT